MKLFTLYKIDKPNHQSKNEICFRPITESLDLIPLNRAFLYGDGCFETIKVQKNTIPLWDYHYQRLIHSAYILGIDNPIDPDIIFENLKKLLLQENIANAKLRIHLLRASSSIDMGYKPLQNEPYIIADISNTDRQDFKINKEGIKLHLYEDIQKPINLLSNLKTKNALIYVLAAKAAYNNGCEESLIYNTNGDLIESHCSNLFWIKDKRIYTIPLGDGPVAGVMRQYVLDRLKYNEIAYCESHANLELLLAAEEIFVTNALNGIKWVSELYGKKFGCKRTIELAKEIHEKLNYNVQ